jgi:hypothetical protein
MTDTLTPGQETDEQAPNRPRIDPRIARRWIEVHREQGRKRLRVIVVAVVVAVVVLIAAGCLYTPLMRVRHVRVTVSGSMTAAQVEAYAGLNHYRLMIDIDPASVARRLDAVPYLGGAKVARHWPATVTVSVARRDPVAQVQTATGWALVDPTGRVLGDLVTEEQQVPVLTGAGPVPAPGGWLAGSLGPSVVPGTAPARAVEMNAAADSPGVPQGPAVALVALQALPESVRSDVLSVSDSGGDLTMSVLPATVASGSITVNLGDGSQLALKLNSLATLLISADLSAVASIDLTTPDRPTTSAGP